MFRTLFICLVLFQMVLGHMLPAATPAGLSEREDVRERVWAESHDGSSGEPGQAFELTQFRPGAGSGGAGLLSGPRPGFTCLPLSAVTAKCPPRGPPLRA